METFSGFALWLAIAVSVQAVVAQEQVLTIGLIGDSTVASTYGWGPAFAGRFKEKAKVINYAKNGATLQSLSHRLDELLLLKPDFVLIQFGHNDQKQYDTNIYSAQLASYVDRIKKAGAKPVVLSSVTRRGFDENGKIKPREDKEKLKASLPFYAQAAETVAKTEKVPFIDLYSISVAHHNQIGPEESRLYNYKGTDSTHFSDKGAAAIAALVVAELQLVVPEVAEYLK